MKLLRAAVVIVAIATIACFALQRVVLAQPATNLRILAPENGQKLGTNFVDVRYELTNSSAAAGTTPTYELQVDGNSPVQTTSTEYTFTGLAAGLHTVVVKLVDANGSAVAGSINAVKFVKLQQPTSRGDGSIGSNNEPQVKPASLDQTQTQTGSAGSGLPEAGGALPLLSVIGFGVLLGGIVSALRTR